MAIYVTVPKLGVEMTSARIAQWVKAEGDFVQAGEILVIIETDKIAYEIEAPAAGYVHRVGVEGVEYPIGATLAVIAADKDELLSIQSGSGAGEGAQPAAAVASVSDRSERQSEATEEVRPTPATWRRASPLARKMAREHGIDLSCVRGTGPGGAILKRDILAVLEKMAAAPAEKPTPVAVEPATSRPVPPAPTDVKRAGESSFKRVREIRPLQGMRRVIAERMRESLLTTAQMTDINEIEVTQFVRFRQELNEECAEMGFTLSYTDLFVKAAAILLKEMPVLNASIRDDEIVIWDSINIGVAVALEDGLIVPVIHDADKLSLMEIHYILEEKINKARSNKLLPDDISGGTFTITNFGSYGGYLGTPILNLPEVAILGIGAIKQKPIVREGRIEIADMMGYSLTVDHRLIDGAVAGRFQQLFARLMAKPRQLLIR